MQPGQVAEITPTRLDRAGAGVADTDSGEVIVAELLPGETAEVRAVHRSQHHARTVAEIVRRTSPHSPARAVPACPAYGDCGGCRWQHLSYSAQLDHKRDRVVRALAAHSLDAVVAKVVPSPAQLGYRNQGKYVIVRGDHGPVVGAYRPGTGSVVSTLGCRIVDPVIDRTARALAGALSAAPSVSIYHPSSGATGLRYAIVRADEGGGVLLTLVATRDADSDALAAIADVVAGELEKDSRAHLVGALLNRNDRTDGGLLGDGESVLRGEPSIVESLAGIAVALSPRAFFQVNRPQARAIYGRVADLLAPLEPRAVVDVFCGVGGFALHIAGASIRTTALDSSAPAIEALQAAAREHALPLEAVCADAASLAEHLAADVDAVIVNPPRKGLGAAVIGAVRDAAPKHVIYTSCNPDSLAADVAGLSGYAIERCEPYDLMPGTAEIETLVLASRYQ